MELLGAPIIPTGVTIKEIQAWLVDQLRPSSETASLDAQVLLGHYLDRPRSWILAHPDASLSQDQYENIYQAADRLKRGEPLPYVIGHWEFYGLDFLLTPAVLIPRPETELLVERAIHWLTLHPTKRKAIDVGTGSGCIGISLAKEIPDLDLVLTDISSKALEIARVNAEQHSVTGNIKFIQANLLEGIFGPFDLICANLPYIPTNLLMTLPVVNKEPRKALDGGWRGTELIGNLLEQGRHQLVSGGLMLLEIESSQGDNVKALAKSYYPLSTIQILKDLSGRDRCLEIERPSLLAHICPYEEWLQAQRTGIYKDVSFEQVGIIHCSQPEQVLEVANRFYQGISDLVLMWLDSEKLVSETRWEFVDNSIFPHIYGPINLEAVFTISELQPDGDGVFRHIWLPS
jgi:release factor glutamine methyltransferase